MGKIFGCNNSMGSRYIFRLLTIIVNKDREIKDNVWNCRINT
jgi:hypothetical protein